jgi:hypothetical protein
MEARDQMTPQPPAPASPAPDARAILIRIEMIMSEISSISGVIGKTFGGCDAMYAMNRAWHSAGVARDALTPPAANGGNKP